MRKEVKREDLVDGEIYYCTNSNWSYDYIERYKKDKYCSSIGINKSSGALVFAHSGSYRPAFAGGVGFYMIELEEKQWYEACEKANKIISKEEILKDFNQISEYSECFSETPYCTIGRIYKTKFEDKNFKWLNNGQSWDFYYNDKKEFFKRFRSSTKEAYDIQQLELNKPKFEIGKWYSILINNKYKHLCKIQKIDKNNIYIPESIFESKYSFESGRFVTIDSITSYKEVFLSIVEPFLPKKQEEFKVGNWVIVTDFGTATIANSFSLNKAYKLSKDFCKENGFIAEKDNNGLVNNGWNNAFTLGVKIRKALSHEIPKDYISECNSYKEPSKEELLEEAKRRYPIGTKYISLVNSKDVIKSNDIWSWQNNTLVINRGARHIYEDGRWAEIISISKFEEQAINLALNSNYGRTKSKDNLLQEPITLSKRSKKSKLIIVNQ